jgi:hypothetical protein
MTQFCMGCNLKRHRASRGVREYKKGKKIITYFMNDSPEPVEAQPLLSGYCVFFEIRLD